MYTDTITLFVRKEGDEGDTWYPSVLRNVHLNMDKAAILAKYGADSADSAVLHIRYRQVGDDKMVGDKRWLPPKQWETLGNPAKDITFTSGNRFDFFWFGDWGNENPVHDSDYAGTSSPGFYQYMNKTMDYVFAITSVGGPYSVIPHFEIMGK